MQTRTAALNIFLMIGLLLMFSSDILINELRVTSYYLYELSSLHELRVTFYMQVTSYSLLHELRFTMWIRVTSYCLLHELRVTFCMRVASHCLLRELLF